MVMAHSVVVKAKVVVEMVEEEIILTLMTPIHSLIRVWRKSVMAWMMIAMDWWMMLIRVLLIRIHGMQMWIRTDMGIQPIAWSLVISHQGTLTIMKIVMIRMLPFIPARKYVMVSMMIVMVLSMMAYPARVRMVM